MFIQIHISVRLACLLFCVTFIQIFFQKNYLLNIVQSSSDFPLVSYVDDSNMLFSHGACLALGEIARNGPLPIPHGELAQSTAEDSKAEESKNSKRGKSSGGGTAEATKASLVKKLIGKLDSIKFSMKV